MANLNKVMLIGRLTRDPEVRVFPSGGKVAQFGFAVNNRRKNPSSGVWEDEPVFLDVEAFNRGETGKTADLVEQYLRKGHQAFIEGHLKLDQWTGQDGQKRSKLKIVVDNVQFLEPRADGQGGSRPASGGSSSYRRPAAAQPMGGGMGEDSYDAPPSDPMPPMDLPPANRPEEDIPF
jgi:single-strand DNA-binding protein